MNAAAEWTCTDMKCDIAKYRKWALEHIPPTPQRPCTTFLYIDLYHDQLVMHTSYLQLTDNSLCQVEDLGVSKYLHGGIFDDFKLYYPATYRPLVSLLGNKRLSCVFFKGSSALSQSVE